MAELTPKQRLAITALLESKSITEAARKCHLSERTFYRWLATDDFRAELQRAGDLVIDQVARRLAGGAATALDTLEDVMLNGLKDAPKVTAANSWLDHLLKIRELAELEKRLEALEAAANVK